jgi:hypothetical protein
MNILNDDETNVNESNLNKIENIHKKEKYANEIIKVKKEHKPPNFEKDASIDKSSN